MNLDTRLSLAHPSGGGRPTADRHSIEDLREKASDFTVYFDNFRKSFCIVPNR